MTKQEMIDRYYEFQKMLNHAEYTLGACEMQEYQELCTGLLYLILQDNADVFQRLKDR